MKTIYNSFLLAFFSIGSSAYGSCYEATIDYDDFEEIQTVNVTCSILDLLETEESSPFSLVASYNWRDDSDEGVLVELTYASSEYRNIGEVWFRVDDEIKKFQAVADLTNHRISDLSADDLSRRLESTQRILVPLDFITRIANSDSVIVRVIFLDSKYVNQEMNTQYAVEIFLNAIREISEESVN